MQCVVTHIIITESILCECLQATTEGAHPRAVSDEGTWSFVPRIVGSFCAQKGGWTIEMVASWFVLAGAWSISFMDRIILVDMMQLQRASC